MHLSREHEINRVRVHTHNHVTVDNRGNLCRRIDCRIFPDKITTTDNKHVDIHDNLTGTDIPVLVNHHCHDIRTRRTASVSKRNPDTRTTHDTGKYRAHEFVLQQRLMNQIL